MYIPIFLYLLDAKQLVVTFRLEKKKALVKVLALSSANAT